jgi:hypothetical protein
MISSSHQCFREDNAGATVDGDRGAVDERCLLDQQKAFDDLTGDLSHVLAGLSTALAFSYRADAPAAGAPQHGLRL